MTIIRLFDDFQRHETRPSGHSEPHYSYYNVSARPPVAEFRNFLEEWFTACPARLKREFESRFRSLDNSVHQSAFFELYLFRLLGGMGYQVEVHPPTANGKHIDFLAFTPGGPAFYLEATLALPPSEQSAAEKRVAQAYDTLNSLESPNFFLYLTVEGSPESPIPGAQLRKEVARWLSTLDPDEIALLPPHSGPSLLWSHDGWQINIEPIAKGPKYRGVAGVRPIGVTFPEFKWLDTPEYVKRAVERKGEKYRNLDLPLVLAVNVMDDFCDETAIFEGLIGDEEVVVHFGADHSLVGHSMRRKLNGAWFDEHGPRNTSISAVFVASHLNPWSMAAKTPILVHNPWSRKALISNLWPLQQYTGSTFEDCFSKQPGRSACELLGIPEHWPSNFE